MKALRFTWLWSAAIAVAVTLAVGVLYYSDVWWLTATGAMLVAILVMLYFAVIRPMQTVGRGMELLRGQDYSSRLAPVGQPDADRIVTLFNSMMQALKQERLLQYEQNSFLSRLIDASPMGILLLDFDKKITRINPWGRKILGIEVDAAAEILLDDLHGPLADTLRAMKPGETITVNLRWCGTGIFRCSRLWFMDRGFRREFFMVESLTDDVRRAEKDAFAKVIRTMAHEVNNTMAGLQSMFETLAATYNDDPDVVQLIDGCSRRCHSMGRFISLYADVVKIPEPVAEPLDLCEWVAGRLPFLEAVAHGIAGSSCRVSANLPRHAVIVMADGVLMEQVFVNLVKNAAESIRSRSGNGGGNGSSTDPGRATDAGLIDIVVSDRPVTISVTDNGVGIAPEMTEHLFTSFFTSKPGGHGLGLMCVAEILSGHKCRYSLSNRPGPVKGAVFSIQFPDFSPAQPCSAF